MFVIWLPYLFLLLFLQSGDPSCFLWVSRLWTMALIASSRRSPLDQGASLKRVCFYLTVTGPPLSPRQVSANAKPLSAGSSSSSPSKCCGDPAQMCPSNLWACSFCGGKQSLRDSSLKWVTIYVINVTSGFATKILVRLLKFYFFNFNSSN